MSDQARVALLVDTFVRNEAMTDEERSRLSVLLSSRTSLPRDGEATIDTAAEGFLRIGPIYLRTGGGRAESGAAPLVHTQQTIQQLATLAAATHSGRAILLEGATCSRKSALVHELARLARRKLVVIPLHESSETGDLIGQWLPVSVADEEPKHYDSAREVLHDGIEFLLLVGLPSSSEAQRHEWLKAAEQLVALRLELDTTVAGVSGETSQAGPSHSDSDGSKPSRLSAYCQALRVLQRQLQSLASDPGLLTVQNSHVWRNQLLQRAAACLSGLRSLRSRNTSGQKGFQFVESPLVKALKAGHWVLLENIASAPPDVIERLNSLTESRPTLNMYEHPDGTTLVCMFAGRVVCPHVLPCTTMNWCTAGLILARGVAGGKLDANEGASDVAETIDDGESKGVPGEPDAGTPVAQKPPRVQPIHEDFRLFATTDMARGGVQRLSSAALSRLLRIWLPPIDSGLREHDADHVEHHDLFDIVCHLLAGIDATRELAMIALGFHRHVLTAVADGKATLMPGFSVSFRTLRNACWSVRCHVRNGITPGCALALACRRAYLGQVPQPKERQALLMALHPLFTAAAAATNFTRMPPMAKPHQHLDGKLDTAKLISHMVNLERAVRRAIATVLAVQLHTADFRGSNVRLLRRVSSDAATFLRTACPGVGLASSGVWGTDGLAAALLQVSGRDLVAHAGLADVARSDGRASVDACMALRADFRELAREASLQDAEQREVVLRHALQVVSCLAHMAGLETVMAADIAGAKSLRKALLELECGLNSLVRWFEALQMKDIRTLRNAVLSSIHGSGGERTAAWAVQAQLHMPIRRSFMQMRDVLRMLIAKGVHSDGVLHYSSALLWQGMAWDAANRLPDDAVYVDDGGRAPTVLLCGPNLIKLEVDLLACDLIEPVQTALRVALLAVRGHTLGSKVDFDTAQPAEPAEPATTEVTRVPPAQPEASQEPPQSSGGVWQTCLSWLPWVGSSPPVQQANRAEQNHTSQHPTPVAPVAPSLSAALQGLRMLQRRPLWFMFMALSEAGDRESHIKAVRLLRSLRRMPSLLESTGCLSLELVAAAGLRDVLQGAMPRVACWPEDTSSSTGAHEHHGSEDCPALVAELAALWSVVYFGGRNFPTLRQHCELHVASCSAAGEAQSLLLQMTEEPVSIVVLLAPQMPGATYPPFSLLVIDRRARQRAGDLDGPIALHHYCATNPSQPGFSRTTSGATVTTTEGASGRTDATAQPHQVCVAAFAEQLSQYGPVRLHTDRLWYADCLKHQGRPAMDPAQSMVAVLCTIAGLDLTSTASPFGPLPFRRGATPLPVQVISACRQALKLVHNAVCGPVASGRDRGNCAEPIPRSIVQWALEGTALMQRARRVAKKAEARKQGAGKLEFDS